MADALASQVSRYSAMIERIFFDRYKKGATEVPFERIDLEKAATKLKIALPKNLGDVLYSVRYRTPMPAAILATQPKGREWIIEGTGRAKYAFKLVTLTRVKPSEVLAAIAIPDATPELIRAYALDDEQALQIGG